MRKPSYLAHLRSQGFDLSTHTPFTKYYRPRCSQCEVLCINGMACHETGCPHIVREEESDDEY